MSWHSRLLEEARQDLRQVEREMQSEMRLLDLHLQQLREDLPTCCPHHVRPCCLHQPDACPWERRAITARMDAERELKRLKPLLEFTYIVPGDDEAFILAIKNVTFLFVMVQQVFTGTFGTRAGQVKHPLAESLHTKIPIKKYMQRRLNKTVHSFHDHRLLALIDMKDFDPREVSVTVKDGKVKVVAEHKEEIVTSRGKEYNYKNTSQEISLPSGVSEDEVTYSLCPNNVLKIEAVRCCPYSPST